MKVFLLFTGSGPLVILTSHDSVETPALLDMLAAKGTEKFIAHEIPFGIAQERYGGHFTVVSHDLKESDALHVLSVCFIWMSWGLPFNMRYQSNGTLPD